MQAKYRWDFTKSEGQDTFNFSREFGLPPALARVLYSRGIATCEQARRFLLPNIKQDLTDPAFFPGIADAVERIWLAITGKEPVMIFGDFDVDGIAAAVILKKALAALGADASVFLPQRSTEGYGFTLKALQRALLDAQPQPTLIITVDCGIGAVAEVAWLREQGIDVIITDHHECAPIQPAAVAVINPHLGAPPGAESICGAGVAFKLAHALIQYAAQEGVQVEKGISGQWVVLAGLASVADVVPLTGENRLFAASAMKLWRNHAGAGLRQLMLRAQTGPAGIPDAYTFGFVLGPRINAAGRMDSAMKAYELLTTEDIDLARGLAAQLEGYNGERRGIQTRILKEAREQCGVASGSCQDAAIVVGGLENSDDPKNGGWHPGVVGIVAAQLSEESGKPAAVIVFNSEGGGRGSVRAGAGYHALLALTSAAETLDGFGGHAQAAGFQLKPGCFEHFKALFCQACAEHSGNSDTAPAITVEAWIEPDELSLEMASQIERLAPFGMANRMPLWAMRGVTIESLRVIGSQGEHMQFVLKMGSKPSVRAVWFRCGNLCNILTKGDVVDLVFELLQSDFRGSNEVELRIVDMALRITS
ncbi:MAG: single-stranded-DNA-specific exonuclease RecJ [Kiritimatiellae bacterium]|nr:single-stranded-DNA-specific exonuclease RecJ [Kiritimatiellia bacterium]